MASLTALNNFSLQGFAYNDSRPFGITIASTAYTSANINVQEDSSHYHQPLSSITEVHSAVGANVSYTIYPISVGTGTGGQTLTSLPKVTWPTLPAGLTQTSNAAGYSTVGNITSVSQWNAIKSPLITAPDDVSTTWSYGAKISYLNNGSQVNKEWTVNATVSSDLAEFTTPSTFGYVANITSIVQGPAITNANATGNYTVTITANNTSAVSTITTSGSGSQSWNASTKTLTLTGTKAQLNGRLNAISFTPTSNFTSPITLIYSMTNPSGLITTLNQNGSRVFVTTNRYFVYDRVGYLYEDSPPQFANVSGNGSDYRFELALSSNIGIISGGDSITTPSGWTSANLTYAYTDTYANCNAKLGNIVFAPYSGTVSDSTLLCRLYQGDTVIAYDLVNLKGQASTGATGSGNVVTFTTSSTFTPTAQQAAMNCDILVIGGGGHGGSVGNIYATLNGAGGGAGGLRHSVSSQIFKNRSGQTFNINVGSGGNDVTWTNYGTSSTVPTGKSGFESNIVLGSTKLISAVGGGGAGGANMPTQANLHYSTAGLTGGSGGGGGPLVTSSYNHNQGGNGIYGQGYAGANGANLASGGGGGAGGPASGTSAGAGYICNITGANVTYAEGGKANGGTVSTAYGSGGNGVDNDTSPIGDHKYGYMGKDGVVILRFY